MIMKVTALQFNIICVCMCVLNEATNVVWFPNKIILMSLFFLSESKASSETSVIEMIPQTNK